MHLRIMGTSRKLLNTHISGDLSATVINFPPPLLFSLLSLGFRRQRYRRLLEMANVAEDVMLKRFEP